MSSDELRELERQHQDGEISTAEFDKQREALLSAAPPPLPGEKNGAVSPAVEQQTKQWAMILHLSQLANFVVPFSGIVAPIIIWQVKKAELPGLEAHGKIVANWLISTLIYTVPIVLLCFVLIGFPLLFALSIMAIAYPIIGGIKANNGVAWKYPLSLPIFK